MKNTRPLTTRDGEVRHDLTEAELALFKPARDVLTDELQRILRVNRRLVRERVADRRANKT
ncbi:hypothetical protein [Luteibacter yeojuensis]|uniref:Uncharacterized protein n=1 Tax=Luteibacter yeojuensis TaxID=345309 RepID=A0A0F3KIH7_9GAMM|nr:hypothetical protein [Luteibacter yeojuensis]KJV30966.1 hypothetical protein VI08_14585 [Luteibacter yeojuensis]